MRLYNLHILYTIVRFMYTLGYVRNMYADISNIYNIYNTYTYTYNMYMYIDMYLGSNKNVLNHYWVYCVTGYSCYLSNIGEWRRYSQYGKYRNYLKHFLQFCVLLAAEIPSNTNLRYRIYSRYGWNQAKYTVISGI